MEIRLHPDARRELGSLDDRERKAMDNALDKLERFGISLGFPHSSQVRGAARLRELRPRAGRSRWRAQYRVEGGVAHVLAVVPDGAIDRRAFRRGTERAERRWSSS
jgi:hypothetical protein